MITLGHDEYWSTAMRTAATTPATTASTSPSSAATRSTGTSASPTPHSARTAWRSTTSPSTRTRTARPTRWKPPRTGGYHRTRGRKACWSATPTSASPAAPRSSSPTPTNWLLNGIVHAGQTLPGVVGIEYSGVDLDAPTPRPIEVLFHSPVICGTTRQHDFADAIYYTTPSGAGVFESGTQDWVCGMDPYCTGPAQAGHVAPILDAISTRLFTTFAAGPARPRTPRRRQPRQAAHQARHPPTVAAPDVD